MTEYPGNPRDLNRRLHLSSRSTSAETANLSVKNENLSSPLLIFALNKN